jgi:UMF1 family MFS transporter
MVDRGRRATFAWALYDWANSAFTTLVVTFVYGTYFSQAIASDAISGTALWSRAIVVTGIVVALASPILGALADRSGSRKRYLLVFTLVCVTATASLTFVAPGQSHAVLAALALVVVANVAFEIGMVFYNAFLPDIAQPGRIGRVSGYGWALGYAGGLACLGLALVVLVRDTPLLGIPTVDGFNYRATNLLVAAWFLAFSMPLFVYLHDPPASAAHTEGMRETIRGALGDIAATLRGVRRYREVVKFVVARMIYNDGLVTIFAFGGIYAAGTFGMTLEEVIHFGIALNVAAGLGAWLFGTVDDRIGGKATVMISLVGLVAMTVLAVLATDRTTFWIAGLGIGLLVGPNQSASRSLMGRFVPERHQNEFFGFFAFSGKLTAFMGPLLLGVMTEAFASQRLGIASVLVFFVIGALVLATVDERRGIAAGLGVDGAGPDG